MLFPVPISNAYNEGYNIGRKFSNQKVIKEDIYHEKDVRDSHIYLAKTEEEYTPLLSAASRKQCALNRQKNQGISVGSNYKEV